MLMLIDYKRKNLTLWQGFSYCSRSGSTHQQAVLRNIPGRTISTSRSCFAQIYRYIPCRAHPILMGIAILCMSRPQRNARGGLYPGYSNFECRDV